MKASRRVPAAFGDAAAPPFNRLSDQESSARVPAIVLFGSPGSGKGTQAKLLREQCVRGPHISTGDMLRQHIEAGDEIGKDSERLIRSGRLVADELVNELVEKRITEPDCRWGVLLDGYPRTLNQVRMLLDLLPARGFSPAVIHLVVDYEKIVARLSGRRQCPVCGTLYSLKTNPPKAPGICDLDGTPLVTREDDRESVIRQRLSDYESLTRPLLDYFHSAGVPVFEINGAGAAPEQISQQICSLLASSGLAGNATASVGDSQTSVMR